jgi:hypothetical protein
MGENGRDQDRCKMRPPVQEVKLVLPAWGHRFIRQFLDFCLPTLLAPGNIPALAEKLPCTFLLMTTAEDLPLVTAHPAWHRLEGVCRTETRLIGNPEGEGSAITLTRAYTRAVREAGAAMLDTCFIFLVADYIVAEGSLAAVLARVESGASAVLAGNLQAVAETGAPALRARLDEEATELALPPRALMDWALHHLHPATLGNVVGPTLAHDGAANRLFWRIDECTMLGRFYLMHMIGVRPEIVDFVVGASCDYAFVPEMCPSGNVYTLTDSDEYLVVEMQPGSQHSREMRFGPIEAGALAHSLGEWATAEHRSNIRHALVFHSADIPASLPAACEASQAFVEAVARRLDATPQPSRGHPYWVRGMVLRRHAGFAEGEDDFGYRAQPAESARPRFAKVAERVAELRLALLGRPPAVRPWHPAWGDLAVLRAAIVEQLGARKSFAVIADMPMRLAGWLGAAGTKATAIEAERLLDQAVPGTVPPRDSEDLVLLVLSPQRLDRANDLVAAARRLLAPSGKLVVALVGLAGDEPGAFDADSLARLDLSAGGLVLEEAHYVRTGRLRQAVQQAMLRVARAAMARPILSLPLAAPAGALLALACLAFNRAAYAGRAAAPRGPCSSLVAVLRAAPLAQVELAAAETQAKGRHADARESSMAWFGAGFRPPQNWNRQALR